MANEAQLLADLLEGRITPAEAPPELVDLAELAGAVSSHIALVPPTEAFREALREQVVESVGGAAAGGGAAGATGVGPGAATVATTSASGGLPALIAGVTATAVLATSGMAAAQRTVPGDLLYDAKRSIESAQLAVAGDERDVELLAGFAAERVREAIGLVDVAAVDDLLLESERLLDEALALAVAQGRDLEELLRPYAGALVTLSSRTEDPGVATHVDQLLADLGVEPVRDATTGADGGGLSGGPQGGEEDAPGHGATDGDSDGDEAHDTSGEGSRDGPLDELDDPLEDPVDELGDTLEGPVDELGDTLEDSVETVDELGDVVEDAAEDTGDLAEDATGLLDD